jgi:DNA-binding transcriptional LysR family regulator
MSSLENFRLKVFRIVAEKRSFRQAAEALFLTQPAVTLQIKALEETLGTSLFDRSGNTIELTRAGRKLLTYAQRLQKIAADAEHDLFELQGQEQGDLRIGASTTIAQYVLPSLIGEFKRLNPRVHLIVLGANTEAIVRGVVEERLALGLIEGPSMRRDVKVEPFLTDAIALIAPPHHEWGGEPITMNELAAADLVMREEGSGTRRVVEAALKEAGLARKLARIAMELDSTEAIKSAVESGLGVGFVSERAIQKELRLGSLQRIFMKDLKIERELTLVFRRGPEPNGAAGAFVRFLRDVRDSKTPASVRRTGGQGNLQMKPRETGNIPKAPKANPFP